jgi:hypothetical protein
MHIGNYEIVWPGLIGALPFIFVFIIFPGLLIYGIFKYTRLSPAKKILLMPICLVGPTILTELWSLLLSLSGFFQIGSIERGNRSMTWHEVYNLFGHNSCYIWSIITGIVIYNVFIYLKRQYKECDMLSRGRP